MRKRKTTIIEDYYGTHAPSAKRGLWQRILDSLLVPERASFYPEEDKRHFFEDGLVLRSVAMADGMLYAGCCGLGCPRRCVYVEEFMPDERPGSRAFEFALRAHNDAVRAHDLDVAAEQRAIVDKERHALCRECRAENAQKRPVLSSSSGE